VSFDEAYYSRLNRPASVATDYAVVESFSGYALDRGGESVAPFLVPALDQTGRTNAACGHGAIRFWFNRSAESANARLIEMIELRQGTVTLNFSLRWNEDCASICLDAATDGGTATLLEAKADWALNQWHLITLNYGSVTELYLNDACVAQGPGVVATDAAETAVVIGSAVSGLCPAGGAFDEVCFFGRPLTGAEVARYHRVYSNAAALGPMSEEEIAAQIAVAGLRKAQTQGGGGVQMDSLQNCTGGGPVFLTNLVSVLETNGAATVTFELWGGTNGVPYDLYGVENLTGNHVTNWLWRWLGVGYSCNSYTFTNQPASQSFYFAAVPPPKLAPGLRMWLAADTNLVALEAGTTNKVRTWLDRSETGNSAQQLTLNNQPLFVANWLNGRPAIWFAGTNYFRLLTNLVNGVSQAEAFLVLQAHHDYPANHRGLWTLQGNGSGGRYPDTLGAVADNFGRASGDGIRSGIPSLAVSQPHIYNVASQAGEWTSRLNGVLHFSTRSNVVGFPTAAGELGRNGFGEYFDGYIGEVLFYDRVLTEAERDRIEAYLNRRYGWVTVPPASPSNLVAQAVSPTQVSVAWDASLSNTNVTFVLERKTNGGAFLTVASLRNSASHLDGGLETNTAYTYRVAANNWAGAAGYSTEASVTTAVNGAEVPLAALKLWLKADCGRGASPLDFWADQSGSGNPASQDLQSAKDHRPLVVENGIATNKPVIGFFTTNFLTFRYFTNIAWTAAEGFAVLRARSYAPAEQREHWCFGANLAEYPTRGGSSATNAVFDNFFDGNNTHSIEAPLEGLTAFHLYNPQATSNSWSSRFNGVTYSAGNTPVFTVQEFPRIGAGGNTKPWDGEMAEFMIFDRALSPDERVAVENYLNRRYWLW